MKKDNKFNPDKIQQVIEEVEKEYNKVDEWLIHRDRASFYLTHDFHPYFAAYPPELVKRLLEKYSKEGETFLDPFMGGGSSVVEGFTSKRKTIGIDISPFAEFLSRVKAQPVMINRKKINDLLSTIKQDIFDHKLKMYKNYTYGFPEIRTIDKWFTIESKHDMGIIYHHIMDIKEVHLRNFLLIAFSSLIRKVSNARNSQQHVSVKKGKKIPEVFPLFDEKVNLMAGQMEEYVESLGDLKQYFPPKLFIHDIRKMDEIIDSDSVDIIITSPPYGTGSKYTEVNRLHFEWLGLNKPERIEIMEMAKDFKFELKVALEKMHKVLKKGKYCFVVYGDPSTEDSLTRAAVKDAKEVGFKYEGLISCPIEKKSKNHHEKYRRFIPKDFILIFKK